MLEVSHFQGYRQGFNTGYHGQSGLDRLFGLSGPPIGRVQPSFCQQMMSTQAMMFNLMTLFMMSEMSTEIPNFGSCPQACRGDHFGLPQSGWTFPGHGSMYNRNTLPLNPPQQTPWIPPRFPRRKRRASRTEVLPPQQIQAQIAPPTSTVVPQTSAPVSTPKYTVTKTKDYDPTKDAAALYDSMKGGLFGLGTNEKKLLASLKGKSADQLVALKANYKDHYGRDLDKDIRGELSGKTESQAMALLDVSTAPKRVTNLEPTTKTKSAAQKRADARNASKALSKAMNRLGTDEKAIFRTLDGKSKEEIQAIAKAYDAEHKIGLRRKLEKELSGNDLERAKRLLKNGTLSDAARLKYATEGLGTDEAIIKRVLSGKSKEEIRKIKSDYQKETGGRNLDTDLKQELSGRDQFDASMDLKGKAANLSEAVERANEKRDYERKGLGNFVSRNVMDLVSSKGKLLDKNTDRANLAHQRYIQAQAEGRTGDAQVEKKRLEQLLGYADADVGHYRKAEDSAANTAGAVAATAASAAVVVGSGGAATPLVVAGWAGTAGAGAKVVTSAAIKGGSYGTGDLVGDATTGAVDGLAMVAGAGAGRAATKALQTSGRGALISGRTAAFAFEGAVDGLVAGGISSGGGAVLRDGTWDQGIGSGLKRVGVSTGYGAGLGTLAGAGVGAAIGVAPKVVNSGKALAQDVATGAKKIAGKGRRFTGDVRNVMKSYDQFGRRVRKQALDGSKSWWTGYRQTTRQRVRQFGNSPFVNSSKAKWADYLTWRAAKIHKASEAVKNGAARVLNRPRVENGVTIPDAIFGPDEVIRHPGNVWNRGPAVPAKVLSLPQ